MVFNTTFNNISAILVEETGVPKEKQLTCRKSLTNFTKIRMFLYARIYWLAEFEDVSCLQFNYRSESGDSHPHSHSDLGGFCRTILRVTLSSSPTKLTLNSQLQVIKLTSCLPMVGGSLRVLRLLPPLKLVAMILLKVAADLKSNMAVFSLAEI
jgi:hypothetical protein